MSEPKRSLLSTSEQLHPLRQAAHRLALSLLLITAVACSSSSMPAPDGGSSDAGNSDAGDAGISDAGDAGISDAGDAGISDAGDAGISDAGDAGISDAGDAGISDAGDAGISDAGDAGISDAGDAGISDTGDAGSSDAGDAGSSDAGDAGAITTCAQPGASCPANTLCVADLCLPSCANGAACPTGQYCESSEAGLTVCSPDHALPCLLSTQCTSPRTCIDGECAALEAGTDGGSAPCALDAGADDGCAADAICYFLGSTNTCVGLLHCSEDGGCPAGVEGSACNVDDSDGGVVIPGKERLCLIGSCRNSSNCPYTTSLGQASCVGASSAQLGTCSFGVAGDPCTTNADCMNAQLCALADGGVDDGGAPGHCAN